MRHAVLALLAPALMAGAVPAGAREERSPDRLPAPCRTPPEHHGDIGVTGRVLDEQRNPIADAKIFATRADSRVLTVTCGSPLPDAISDHRGMFAVPSVSSDGKRLEGRVRIRVTHDQFVDGEIERTPPASDVTIVLQSGRTVRGMLRDEQGAPVSGNVEVFPCSGSPRRQRVTGAFELRGLPRGPAVLRAWIEPRDARDASEMNFPFELRALELGDEDPAPVAVTLGSKSISGLLTDERGALMGNEYLVLEPVQWAQSVRDCDRVASRAIRAVETDKEGRFRFGGVSPGEYALRRLDLADEYGRTTARLRVRAGEELRVLVGDEGELRRLQQP